MYVSENTFQKSSYRPRVQFGVVPKPTWSEVFDTCMQVGEVPYLLRWRHENQGSPSSLWGLSVNFPGRIGIVFSSAKYRSDTPGAAELTKKKSTMLRFWNQRHNMLMPKSPQSDGDLGPILKSSMTRLRYPNHRSLNFKRAAL